MNTLSKKIFSLKGIRIGIITSIVAILVLTVLEFPAPIGFETRPQDNVSFVWLGLFLAIFISEIATIPLIFKRPRIGGVLGMIVAGLNLIQITADQMHLMQPEIAPLGYLLLEDAVGIFSIILGYLSWKICRSAR